MVKESRWRLFGHILRQAATIPAVMTKNLYFTAAANGGWRGRPRNTLPTVLHADITRAGQASLSNASDLDHVFLQTLHTLTWQLMTVDNW